MAATAPFLTLHVTPRGQLVAARRLGAADRRGGGRAHRRGLCQAPARLLHLGASEVTTPLPALFAFWRAFAARYVTTICHAPESAGETVVDPPASSELTDWRPSLRR